MCCYKHVTFNVLGTCYDRYFLPTYAIKYHLCRISMYNAHLQAYILVSVYIIHIHAYFVPKYVLLVSTDKANSPTGGERRGVGFRQALEVVGRRKNSVGGSPRGRT